MGYRGSCHCGAIAFAVDGEPPKEAMSCNCSHCRRKGFLLTFVPVAQFALESGEAQLVAYTFNKHKIEHQFCRTCGTQVFAKGEMGGAKMRAVNLRCVPQIDLEALEVRKVDGASF